MIVRHLQQIEGGPRTVSGANWTSRRLLLAADGMGFSMHDTLISAGTSTRMHYRYHLEAVYCIEGDGELERVGSDERYRVQPGMLYALDQHDCHVLHAHTALRLICVFSPPLCGEETHDADGSYPPPSGAAGGPP